MIINSVNLATVKEHLAEKYELSADKIDFMLNGLKPGMKKNFSTAELAVANNDFSELAKAAHSIKGALLNLGEDGWADIARNIESAANEGDDRCFSLLLKELRVGVSALIGQSNSYLESK